MSSLRLNFRAGAIFLLAGSIVLGQEPVKPPLTPRIITATKQVTQFSALELQLLQAVQKKDKAALEALLADDFQISMPDADPLAGEDWVEAMMDKNYTLKSFALRQVTVNDLGNAAVVAFERGQQASFKGKDDNGQFFVIDVWKKDGDTWTLVSRYVSQVNKTAPVPNKPTGKK